MSARDHEPLHFGFGGPERSGPENKATVAQEASRQIAGSASRLTGGAERIEEKLRQEEPSADPQASDGDDSHSSNDSASSLGEWRECGEGKAPAVERTQRLTGTTELIEPAVERRSGIRLYVQEFEAHTDAGLDDADHGQGFYHFVFAL